MQKRPAFTLIELLVVISVIALLIAILLPALAAARKSAQQAACLSSQRQVALGVVAYGVDYDQDVPLGFIDGPNYSYTLYSALVDRRLGFGQVWEHVPDVRVADMWRCPSVSGPDWVVQRMGDSAYPPPESGSGAAADTASAYDVRPFRFQNQWPYWDLNPSAAATSVPANLDRDRIDSSVAIFADNMNQVAMVDQRHENGINVAYGDGSAGFLRRDETLSAPVNEVDPGSPTSASLDDIYAANPGDPQTTAYQAWPLLDR